MPKMSTSVDESKLSLMWETTTMSTSSIARTLGVSRTTVRRIARRLRLSDRPPDSAMVDGEDFSDLADLTEEEISKAALEVRMNRKGVRMHKETDGDR